MVLTCQQNLNTKARAVQTTWAKDCDETLFISDRANASFPALEFGQTGRNFLWSKTREVFLLAFKNYLTDFDWFVKADDDTYFFINNLKKLTSEMNPHYPQYLGRIFKGYLRVSTYTNMLKKIIKVLKTNLYRIDSMRKKFRQNFQGNNLII